MSKSQEWFISLVIVCVLGTVVALGIWWNFNSTEWAAWVQALGSVAAILVAVWVMRSQNMHNSRLQRQLIAEEAIRKTNSWRWFMISIVNACESTASNIGAAHVTWDAQSEGFDELRKFLVALPLDYYSDQSLLLRSMEIIRKMRIAKILLSELTTHQGEEDVNEAVKGVLNSVRDDALTGFTEATQYLLSICSEKRVQLLSQLMPSRFSHREMAQSAWKEAKSESSKSSI